MNIYKRIKESAKRWPDRVAIIDEKGRLTFFQLIQTVEILQNRLKEQGLCKGQGLGILARNGRGFIFSLLAGLARGAVVMPLSTQLTPTERQDCMDETKLHALLNDGTCSLDVEQTDIGEGICFSWTGFDRQRDFVAHIKNAAIVRFTSGTTGKSKGVILSHKSVLERIAAAQKALDLNEEDTVIWVLPMAYHFVVTLVLYLRFGITLAVCPDFLAKNILDYTQKFKGTHLYASPMHYQLLAAAAESHERKQALSSLKMAISTSSSISLETIRKFQKRYGVPIIQAFGIIEVGLPLANFKSFQNHPEALGHTLADYEVAILDEQNEVLPPERLGQLALRGPGMFSGYLNPPQTSREILKKGWFLTGDLAQCSAEGLVTLRGRKKSMINVSGNKVFAEEVEAVLNTHPSIEISQVYGENHALMGEVVLAKVVPRTGHEIDLNQIRAYCLERLSPYKVPQRFDLQASLTLTGSGKIMRHKMHEVLEQ